MFTRFTASQSIDLVVPEQPIPIQHYLRQPHRLVSALFDPNRVEQRGDCFRLKMRPLAFMMLNIQPVVDLKVWAESDGTVHVKSVKCELRGIEHLSRGFALNLVGLLSPDEVNGVTELHGRADLEVQVDLPALFMFTPKSLIEMTGNGLLKSVLMTMKQRLMHQILLDYRHWAAETPASAFNLGMPINTLST